MQEELFQSFKKFRVGQVNEDYYDRDEEESEEQEDLYEETEDY